MTAAPSFAQAAAAPAQAPAEPAQAPAAAVPNARVFNGGAGLILYTIKAANTADFEMVLNRTKEALMKSEKPERKQQAASWRVYKSDTPGANGNVTYVMIIDPAVKEADYNIVNILNEAFPAEIQALFKSYTESFASGLIPINLVPVVDYSK
jgi:23S rRNA G2069 N7-methylase RlmK/C1962 C5-methylase RlmI